jgi:hypothetical protein
MILTDAYRGKAKKNSALIARAPVEIRAEHLPNETSIMAMETFLQAWVL